MTLDTPEQIDAFRLQTIKRGLEFEIKTGMRMTRGNMTLHAAQQLTGKRTRPACLAAINKMIEEAAE